MKKLFLFATAFLATLSSVSTQADNRSTKRGFGENKLYYVEDLNALGAGCTWYYNWGPEPYQPKAGQYVNDGTNVAFVPMAWNGGFDTSKFDAYFAKHPEEQYILGFNEPNFREQSNMTPEQAVEPWHKLVEYATAKQKKLIAPALNYSAWTEYSTPDKWMDEFIEKYKAKYGVDPRTTWEALALHCYMDYSSAQTGYVEEYAKKYGQKVWLTEFCAWENVSSSAFQEKQMLLKLNDLEKSTYVDRYAWFQAKGNVNSKPYNALLTSPKGTLTTVGFAYVNFPNYAQNTTFGVDSAIAANKFVDINNVDGLRPCSDPKAANVSNSQLFFGTTGGTVKYNVNGNGEYYLIVRGSTNEVSEQPSQFYVQNAAGENIAIAYRDSSSTEDQSLPSNNRFTLPDTPEPNTYVGVAVKIKLTDADTQIVIKKANAKAANISMLKLVKVADANDLKSATGTAINPGGGGTDPGQNPDKPENPGDNISKADGVKITDAATEPYKFDANAKYYSLYLDETTRKANGLGEGSDRFVNLGDNGGSQNLWIWQQGTTFTFDYATPEGKNSFGVDEAYQAFTVADQGWSGMGYNIDASKGDLDLSHINKDYTFHMALKSVSKESFDFYLTDSKGHTAHIVLGDKAVDGRNPIGNFKRDGKWHNVDIKMSYLQQETGLNFNNSTDYNGNLLCLTAGGVKGTDIAFDGVFFYGPKDSQPDADYTGADVTVKDIAANGKSDFKFSKDDKVYGIYLDSETMAANNLSVAAGNYVNLGPNGSSQNLYPWDNTLNFGNADGTNSFGEQGNYMNFVVGTASWFGLGYNIANKPVNLSAINSSYNLHFAVKTTYTGPIQFTVNDGVKDAKLVFGKEAYDNVQPVGDFTRDGNWHEVIVPVKYMTSVFGTDFTVNNAFVGNIFTIVGGAANGQSISYDAVFFYGPASSKGLPDVNLGNTDIKITKASETPYEFSKDNDYYTIYLDEETQSKNLSADQVTYIGPNEQTRFLYPWDDTFIAAAPMGPNSFGVEDKYMSWTVNNKGWSGLGYAINSPVDLTGITADYKLHLAVKSESDATIEFYVNDPAGHTVYLPLGAEGEKFDNNDVIGNFERNGEWYNIDVPVSYLMSKGCNYGLGQFTGNIFCLLAGGVAGTTVDYDAVFFYGPKKQVSGITNGVVEKPLNITGVQVYNLNGMLVGKAQSVKELNLAKGIYIVRSAKGTKKVIVD